ncbi:hypothetical protein G7046_g4082 [Stylonectria norvegica]|nr:hypothetical protein G7046_g4082 [Stylonectria norvegica]
MEAPPFRVIVVGGGPNGITAAYALYHAGIDFVVLERRSSVVEDVGASLVLSPQNLRVYHQFGILDKITEIGVPLLYNARGATDKAKKFKRSYALSLIPENHGSALLVFHRAHLIQALYSNLPKDAKARFHVGKKLTDIATTPSGVKVTCGDGTTYSGSIVVGADGVYSQTRSVMRRLALEADPSLAATWDPEFPFTRHYKCLWASFPRPSEPGASYETHNHDRSAMYLTGQEKGWIFLYEKLPDTMMERVFYDDKSITAFAKSFADWPLTETLKVKDVLAGPHTPGMTNLEEGIAKNMSWGGKIVLVGDACHKFTPNAGLGLNNGVQDVVSLCNKLKALLVAQEKTSPGVQPETSALQEIFESSQRERRDALQRDYAESADTTRLHAWASNIYYVLSRYVLSIGFVQKFLVGRRTAAEIRKGLVLDYIPATEPFSVKIPWDHPLKALSEK